MDQWLVEPTLSYRVNEYFEPLAGVRYNHLNGELRGPGILPTPVIPSGIQDWWDPIVGANLRLPLGKGFSLNLRGDVGGFGVARISPGRFFRILIGSSPNGRQSRLATGGLIWIMKPAAAPADSSTTSSTRGRNSDSRSIFDNKHEYKRSKG